MELLPTPSELNVNSTRAAIGAIKAFTSLNLAWWALCLSDVVMAVLRFRAERITLIPFQLVPFTVPTFPVKGPKTPCLYFPILQVLKVLPVFNFDQRAKYTTPASKGCKQIVMVFMISCDGLEQKVDER